MPAFRSNDHDRSGGRDDGSSVPGLLRFALASAVVSLVIVLLARRYLARMGPAGALPQPTPIRQPRAVPPVTSDDGTSASDPAEAPASDIEALGRELDDHLEATEDHPASALGAVADGLTPARAAELERLLADPDVVPGDGSDTCPADFPIKGNGRSGIYHWPGAFAYGITHPTLCFRTAEAADRAGFRPAKR